MLIETDPETFWQTRQHEDWLGLLARSGSVDPEWSATIRRRAGWDKASKTQREDFGDRL